MSANASIVCSANPIFQRKSLPNGARPLAVALLPLYFRPQSISPVLLLSAVVQTHEHYPKRKKENIARPLTIAQPPLYFRPQNILPVLSLSPNRPSASVLKIYRPSSRLSPAHPTSTEKTSNYRPFPKLPAKWYNIKYCP
jgi:hypothetical protein